MKYLILIFLSVITFSSITIANNNKLKRTLEILQTGNGSSFDNAYKVERISEEYDVLEYLQIKPAKQILQIINGRYYDVFITSKNEVIYFESIWLQIKNEA